MGRKAKESGSCQPPEHIPGLVALVIAAPDGSFRCIDPRLKDLLDCSIESILNGKGWEKAGGEDPIAETRVATWIEEIESHEPGEWRSGNTTVLREDGSRELIGYITFTLSEGNTLTIFEDLSEHRRIEHLIREGRDLLRSISDNMPDLIWAKDMEGHFLFVNKTMCDFLLKCESPSQAVGKTDGYFAEIVRNAGYKHDFGEMCIDSDAVIHASRRPQKFDEYGYIKGEFVYMEVQKAPLFDPQGNMIGTVGCGRDVTARKRAEEDLRESEERYKTAIEHSNDGVGIVSGTRHLYVNKRYLEMFGYASMEEIINLPPFFTVHPDDRQRVADMSIRRKLGEDVPSLYEFKGVRKDGEVLYVQASVARITYQGERASLAYLRNITEQKRAEEALREREETIRALINASTDATFSARIDGTILAANETLARRLGKPLGQIIGTCAYDYWPDDLSKARKAMISQMVETRHPIHFQDQRDGLWFENSLYPIMDSGGKVTKAAIFSRDITENRLAAEALKESERKYRNLVDNAPVGVIRTTVDGRILYMNDCWAKMCGYSGAEEMTHVNVLSLYKDPARRDEFIERLKAEGEVVDWEGEYVKKDGQTACVLVRANLEGDIISGVAVDITDRKTAEKAVRDSEEKYRNIFDNAVEGIFQTTRGGRFLAANRALARMLGFDSADEMIEAFTDPVTQMYVSAAEYERFATALERDGDVQGFETQFSKKGGGRIWISANARAVRDDEGQTRYFEGFAENITERKRVESELRESVEKLNQTLKETIQAMSVTVEARDPYTAGHQKRVAGFAARIAREMGLPEDTVECVRIAGIIHDIGKLSVPAEILSKPTQLKDVEMGIMRIHSERGYDILKEIVFPWPIADIVLQHHERLDGSGYPAGLKGNQILLEARILAVADVVESMISHRPYRPAHPMDKAVEEISGGRGSLYDGDVVDACLRVLDHEGFGPE